MPSLLVRISEKYGVYTDCPQIVIDHIIENRDNPERSEWIQTCLDLFSVGF